MLDEYLQKDGENGRPEKGKKSAAKKAKHGTAEKVLPIKDADAPKKPLTAFMLYCGHRRAQMKAIDPSKGD